MIGAVTGSSPQVVAAPLPSSTGKPVPQGQLTTQTVPLSVDTAASSGGAASPERPPSIPQPKPSPFAGLSFRNLGQQFARSRSSTTSYAPGRSPLMSTGSGTSAAAAAGGGLTSPPLQQQAQLVQPAGITSPPPQFTPPQFTPLSGPQHDAELTPDVVSSYSGMEAAAIAALAGASAPAA